MVAKQMFAGKYTSNRPDVAVVTDKGEDVIGQPILDPFASEKVETFGVAPSAADNRPVQTMGFIPGVSVQAIQRAGSTDPTDLILFGKGPGESIALGQGFALDSPFVRALADEASGTSKRIVRNPDDSPIVPELFVHVFDLRVSPRSHVFAVQLPGDWSLVKRVQFAGPDRLVLIRFDPERTGVYVCQVEIVSFPSMQMLRQFENVDSDCTVTNMHTFQAFDHAVGILNADRKVRIFDTDSDQRVVETQTRIKGDLWAIAISANRQWMATASGTSGDNELFIHKMSTGELKYRLSSGQELLTLRGTHTIAFSPDDKFLAAGEAQYLVVYDTETGEVAKKFPNTSHTADQIFGSADSRSLTSVTRSFVQNYPDGPEETIYPYVSHWSL